MRLTVRTGGRLWRDHPRVRTGKDLTPGERAADRLKAAFGSWAFLIILNGLIVAWCLSEALGLAHFDPYPFIALNLVLSWLAAQQGGALQIAANRGDRISAEIAAHTEANTEQIKTLIADNTRLTEEVRSHTVLLEEIRDRPGRT